MASASGPKIGAISVRLNIIRSASAIVRRILEQQFNRRSARSRVSASTSCVRSGRACQILGWSSTQKMSVCTGVFVLASTGLLSGKSATTHHGANVDLAMQYPDIHVQRGARFVEAGNLASAGGLTSGMDLALRVVEQYFGRDVASQTASLLEYQGQGWLNPNSNSEFAGPIKQTANHPLCAVCGMEPDRSLSSTYKEKPTISACRSTNESSMHYRKSSPPDDSDKHIAQIALAGVADESADLKQRIRDELGDF